VVIVSVVRRFIVFIVFGAYYPRYFEKSIHSLPRPLPINQQPFWAILVQSDVRFVAVDQTLGLCQRRPAFNRRRRAQHGRVLEDSRSFRSNFISLTLGKVRTSKFEKNAFVIIVQDSGQTSIV
jgi:hypothetical protein